jgi:hypothetical protein
VNTFVEWGSLLNIVLFGLLFGAGLPAVYAVGVRAVQGNHASDEDGQIRWWRKAIAIMCFAVCVAAIVGGVAFIAAGGH